MLARIAAVAIVLLAPHASHAQSLSYWKGHRWVLAGDGTLQVKRQLLCRECSVNGDKDVRRHYFVTTDDACTELADHSFVTAPTSGVVTWVGGVSHPGDTKASRVNASMHNVAGGAYGAGVFVLPSGFSIPYGVTWNAGVGGVDTLVLTFDKGSGISVDTLTGVSEKEYAAAKSSAAACVNTPLPWPKNASQPSPEMKDACYGIVNGGLSKTTINIIVVVACVLFSVVIVA